MNQHPQQYDNWQELRDDLNGHETFVSAGSGSTYTGEEIQDRLEESIEMVRAGANPKSVSNRMPRIEDEDGNRWMRNLVEQEWYDLLADDDTYFDDRIFRDSKTTLENDLPHQGWKLRVTAHPEEGREVADTVLPYLQDQDIAHKVVRDTQSLEGMNGGQEGKFITIYPEVDSYKKDQVMKNGRQQFRAKSDGFNQASINANVENASEIIQDLEELLKHSEVDFYDGPSIDGHNGEEKQYNNSRIHFRYGEFGSTAEVIDPETGAGYTVSSGGGLIGQEGEVIGGSYEGGQIEVLEKPV